MSEPFLGLLNPMMVEKAIRHLRQQGVSQMGARQFLEARPVSSSSDRQRLAQALVESFGRGSFKPAEFKPAEFKPAEFRPIKR